MDDAATTGGHRAPNGRKAWILGGLAAAAVLAGIFAYARRTPDMKVVAPVAAANMHVNDVALEQAAKVAEEGHPDEALKIAQAVIDATPKDMNVDPDAYAVKLLCLYKKGWIVAFGETLAEARFRGAGAKELLGNSSYKDMLEKDKAKKKLPQSLRDQLLHGQDGEVMGA